MQAHLRCEPRSQNEEVFFFYLDDDMSFPGPCAIQFPVFFYHNNLSFLFHLLHVFLHLVKDTAVVLLSYTHKLEKTRENKGRTIILYASLFCRTCSAHILSWNFINLLILYNHLYLGVLPNYEKFSFHH